MIRPLKPKDRSAYLAMAEEFYASPVVLQPVPSHHFEITFDLLMKETPFAEGYALCLSDGTMVGYALLAKTWSQEAGGMVLWIEEIYLAPEARGKGLGTEFFHFLEKNRKENCLRFRLEVEKENERAVSLYRSLGFEFFPYDQMKKEF